MKPCMFGLLRPSLEVWQKIRKEDETNNNYTCVALRAAGKNDLIYEPIVVYWLALHANKKQ